MRSILFRSVMIITVIGAILPMALLWDNEEAKAQEAGTPMELNRISVYLDEQFSLSPLPPDSTEFQAISIPNGFIRDGLFGYSILPIGHLYWKDVGIWNTPPLRETINLGGEVRVSVYATRGSESGSVSCDFWFYIMRGTEVLLKLEAMSKTLQSGIDTEVVATSRFPSGNDTTIEAGNTLSLMIQARCNGGATLRFGSTDLDSGFTFGSNSLQLANIFMDREKITVEYRDAFMVPWIMLYTELKVDGVILPNEQIMSQINPINRTREIIWERESPPANYEVFISMSYHYSGINNISETKVLTVQKPYVSRIDMIKDILGQVLLYTLLGAIIITAMVLFSRYRKGVWNRRFRELPMALQDESKHRKKKAWKASKKERRREERAGRKERKERDKGEDTGEFSLFKRKEPPSSRSERSRGIILDAENVDEIEL
ncbi:MAG: hypothetical protein JW939_02525 [Candidatus Thermoplasmatota archaeon]|nr:hypothetical protein [Candidatus Thermoplasmatota archaeon]